MIRRLRAACVGLSVFMLPACMGNNQISEPYYTGGGSGSPLVNRPGASPGRYQRQTPDSSPYNSRGNASLADQKFGPILPPDQPKTAIRPDPVADPARHATPRELPDRVTAPAEEIPAKFEQRIAVESPLSDRKWWLPLAVESDDAPKEKPPPKVLIAPDWPQPGSNPTEARNQAKAPNVLPPLDMPPPAANPAPPVVVPPAVNPPADPVRPSTSGTSMKLTEPIAPVVATQASADEAMLVRAMKAFQSNRPEEAVDLLKRLDPTNQEVLLYLMPLLVRLSEGSLSSMPPDELAVLIDRLQAATSMLKSKAALRIDRAVFCRGVRKFADIDPYEPRHEFRPGDMVFLYAELKNFTCEPVQARSGASAPPSHGSFSIRLGASLELRDSRNGVIWRTDLAKNDFAQTPPQDYYHTYRFCVPEKLPPGTYTLWLTVIDKPTNRAIRKPIEMRVGQG